MSSPPSSTPAKRGGPDDLPLRLWILFGSGVAGGALFGVLVGLVWALTMGVHSSSDPSGWVGILAVAALFGGMIGTITGTIAAVGSLIAVLLGDRWMSGTTRRRALIAGVGATVAVVMAWLVFALTNGGHSSDSDFFFGGFLDRDVPLLATATATATGVSLLAGALAALGSWFVERRLAQ